MHLELIRVICDEPELEVPVSRTCCCRGDRWSSHEHLFHSRTGGTFCQERTARQWPNALCGEEKPFAPCIKVLYGKGYIYKSSIHLFVSLFFFLFSCIVALVFAVVRCFRVLRLSIDFGASGGWSRVHQIKLDWSYLKAIFIENMSGTQQAGVYIDWQSPTIISQWYDITWTFAIYFSIPIAAAWLRYMHIIAAATTGTSSSLQLLDIKISQDRGSKLLKSVNNTFRVSCTPAWKHWFL